MTEATHNLENGPPPPSAPPAADVTQKFSANLAPKTVADTDARKNAKIEIPRLGPDCAWCAELWRDFQIRHETARPVAPGLVVADAHNPHIRREVSVKMLVADKPEEHEIRRFSAEARILGQLEHPNIIPVHIMAKDEQGRPFYIMKKLQGATLRETLDGIAAGLKTPLGAAGIGELLMLFLKICEGVSFAHEKGVVHGQLDSAAVHIGEFGEAIISNWSACRLLAGHKIVLTPEQLQLDPDAQAPGRQALDLVPAAKRPDVRNDIHDLGRLLCEMLTLRRPAPPASAIHKLPSRQLPHCGGNRLPRTLGAITAKATAKNPVSRYQTVAQMAADIEAFMQGMPTVAEKRKRLHQAWLFIKRARHQIIILLLAGAVLSAAAGFALTMLFQHRLETARWGPPVVVEDFAEGDGGWRQRWQVHSGNFKSVDGRLITVPGAGDQFLIFLKNKLHGPTTIEFDGECLPGASVGDLSVVWSADGTLDNALLLQTGSWYNTAARITRNSQGRKQQLDYVSFRLSPERRYSIRAEIDETRYTLWVNNIKICEYQDVVPFYSGYVGLYGYFPGKAFGNVRIRSKGVPRQVDSIAVADVLLKLGNYAKAVQEYQNIENSHFGRQVAFHAAFRRGLAHYLSGNRHEAYAVWQQLVGSPVSLAAEAQLLEKLFEEGAHGRISQEITSLLSRSDPITAKQLAAKWNGMAAQTLKADWRLSRTYGNLGMSLFGNEQSQGQMLAALLNAQGRYEEALSHYPVQSDVMATALRELGRPDELRRRCPDLRWSTAWALLQCGEYEELQRNFQNYGTFALQAMLASGKAKDVPKRFPDDRHAQAQALLFSGQYSKLLKEFPEQQAACAEALLRTGKPEKVLENYAGLSSAATTALRMLGRGLEIPALYPENREAAAEALLELGRLDEVAENYPDQRRQWLLAMLRAGRAAKVLEMFPENRSMCAQAMLSLGRFDEVVRDYPEQQQQAAGALLQQRLFDNVLQDYPESQQECAWALLHADRAPGAVAANYPGQRQIAATELLLQGNFADVIHLYPEQRELCGMALLLDAGPQEALRRYPEQHRVRLLGRAGRALKDFNSARAKSADLALAEFSAAIASGIDPDAAPLLPLLRWLLKDRESSLAEAYGITLQAGQRDADMQRQSYTMEFILGKISEAEFMAQPAKLGAISRLILAKAIKTEITLAQAEAGKLYREYLDRPPRRRGLTPLTDLFVRWRLGKIEEEAAGAE